MGTRESFLQILCPPLPLLFPHGTRHTLGGWGVCSEVCSDLAADCYGSLCSFLAWGDTQESPLAKFHRNL